MEDGARNLAVVHQHGDAPADADDQGHAQQIRAARHIGLGDLLLPHVVDEADDDAAHQEQGAELREPPAQNRQGQAHLVKGNHAVNHHQEGQGEDGHDHLPPGGKLHGPLHVGLDFSRAHAHYGPGRVPLHPGGVGHDKPNGRPLKDNPLDGPEEDPLSQRHPGEPRRDARGEGVDGGADDSRPGSQKDNGNAHHGVIARRQKNGNQQGKEGHGLFPHAVGGAAQAEGDHQNRDEPFFPSP